MWSTSGLETLPFALLLFLAFEALLGPPQRLRPALASAACVGLTLVRAEGLAWVGLLLAAAAGRAWNRRDGPAVSAALLCGAIAAATAVALTAFRLTYYGEWLPNTAYVKVGISARSLERGLRYVAFFLLHFPHLLVLVAAGGWVALARSALRDASLQAILAIAAVFGYAVIVSGDFMAMGRLLVPALPFFGVLLACALAALPSRRGLTAVVTAVAITCSLLPAFDVQVPRSVRERFHFRWNRPAEENRSEVEHWRIMRANAERWAAEGRVVSQHTRPGASVVRVAIGAYGYYSGLLIHDAFGLVDREVARLRVRPDQLRSPGHDKGVPRHFFLRHAPDYFVAGFCPRPILKAPKGYATRTVRVEVPPAWENHWPTLFLCLIERVEPG